MNEGQATTACPFLLQESENRQLGRARPIEPLSETKNSQLGGVNELGC